MRKAFEEEYFPYDSKVVCFIELTKDKEIKQVQNYVQEKRDIYYRVKMKVVNYMRFDPDNIEVTCLK